ncbi:hypothetical protein Y032_0078g1190 [Ancylostoma ceylanicum]|uniref:Uncharacterized protein n=1 Tax=Ancylostoma ceylanicum TaxID=53326 RepID=A0A016TSX1_9BILA|nr:hypothetical protein Y032_0078g1190 [Ancylostoma ceylanicum]
MPDENGACSPCSETRGTRNNIVWKSCSAKNERRMATTAIARRLRELCDQFEADEFAVQCSSAALERRTTADKIAQWFLPKTLFTGWRGSYM